MNDARFINKNLTNQKHLMKKRLLPYSRALSSNNIQLLCQLFITITLVLVVLTILSGCSKRYSDLPSFSPIPFRDYPNQSVGRFKTSYLVDQIDSYYRGTNPGPIGVTTFVNVDDLYTTSTFGRMLAEQLMSELSMRGYDVIELRHSDALQFMASAGEFALSRDIAVVRRERDIGGVVVGTYVVSPVRVYINSRLLDPSTSMVLSAGSVEMSKTHEIARMLRGGSVPSTLERIPVKHLGLASFPMVISPNYLSKLYDMEESGAQGLPPVGSNTIQPRLHGSSNSSQQGSGFAR